MKAIIISGSLSRGVLFQFGCTKEEDRSSSLSVYINGAYSEAVHIQAEEKTWSGGFPIGSGQALTFAAAFDDSIVQNLDFFVPGLGLQLHSLTYEGVFHVFAGSGNTFGQSVTPVDSTNIHFKPTSGQMLVNKHHKSENWIEGTFEIEWANDHKDTISLTDGMFRIYYK